MSAPDRWPWLVTLLSPEGDGLRPEGVAFLVDNWHLVTCAHVVTGVLGDQAPAGSISFQIPSRPDLGRLTATVEEDAWFPPQPDETGDIAILKLDDQVPGSQPAPLRAPPNLTGHSVVCRGFTRRHPTGEISRGVLMGRTGPRDQWMQVDSPGSSGFAVGKGFSGGPVWDETLHAVVGMVNGADSDKDVRVGWLIPLDVVAEYWNPLVDLPQLKHDMRRRKQPTEGVKADGDTGRTAVGGSRNAPPASPTANQILDHGATYLQDGRYAEALAQFDQAIQVAARQAPASQPHNSDIYRFLYRYVAGLWDLDRAVRLQPATVEVFRLRGEILRMLRHPEQSLTEFKLAEEYSTSQKQLIGLDWSRAQAYRILDRQKKPQGQFRRTDALYQLNHALHEDPDNTRALLSRGEVNRLLALPEEALKDLNKALQRDPDLVVALVNRGEVYRTLDLPDAAKKDLDRALSIEPTNAAALAVRGAVYRMLGRSEEALNDLDEVIAQWPDRVVPLLVRGEVYRTLGRYEEALRDFDMAITMEPNGTIMLDVRRGVYAVLGDEEDTDFDRVLQLEPSGAEALIDRASVYQLLGRGEEALKDLNSALEAAPETLRAIGMRASVYNTLGRTNEALEDSDRASQMDTDSVVTLLNIGDVNAALGRTDEALKEVNRALGLQPDSVRALLMRADLYKKTDPSSAHRADGRKDLDRAAELNPNSARTFWARGQAYANSREERLSDYQRAVELEPFGDGLRIPATEPIERVINALYLARHDLKPEMKALVASLGMALKEVQLALDVDAQYALALATRGRIYLALRRFDEAISDLKRAYELNPAVRWIKNNLESARRAQDADPRPRPL